MPYVADLVLQSANSPGTGTFQLIAPPAGRRSFASAFGTGQAAYYVAHDGTNWEEGVGTVTAGAPDTLTRDAILANSAGSTAPIGFTGAVQVYCELPASRAIYADKDAVWQGQGRRFAGLAAATAAGDAPRLDQVGWAQVGAAVSLPVGSAGCVFTFPALFNRYRIEYQRLAPSPAAQLYFRASLDGGQTFESNAGEYVGVILQGVGGSALSSATQQTYGQLSAVTNAATSGYLELQTDNDHEYYGQSLTSTGSGFNLLLVGGVVQCAGPINAVFVGAVGQPLSGQLRLLGSRFT